MKKRNIAIQVIFILAIMGIALFEGRTILHPTPSTGFMTVKNFVTAYYTVSQKDYDYYVASLKDGSPKEIPLTDNNYIAVTNTFKPYLSKLSFVSFKSSRLSYKRVFTAYKSNVLIKVKSIKIKENFKKANPKAKTKEYNYILQLNETDRKTKKVTVVSHSSKLTVIDEDNSWQLLSLKPTRLSF